MTRAGFIVLAAAGLLALPSFGQPKASPHETVSATVGGKKISISYGRPYKKGREIFGKLVPYGEVWRTGADEATVLTLDSDFMIGSHHIPAGSYSLFTIPGEKEWTLVLNKVVKQWGAFKYDKGSDFTRVPMTVGKAPQTEQFTIAIESKGGSNGVLKMMWDTTSASIDLMAH